MVNSAMDWNFTINLYILLDTNLSVIVYLVALADIYGKGSKDNSIALLNRLGKRAPPMSINQDLRTLADMYHSSSGSSSSLLNRLGKRVPVSVNQSLRTLADMYNQESGVASKGLLNRLGKRVPAMSVNQVRIHCCLCSPRRITMSLTYAICSKSLQL